ncbi:MAG TPA: SDR family oxidoreductase [Acidimicrobiales bacterium]|nr:SDR family oxidoreductase [Acidimicrobiales bacterium]
MDLGLGGAAVAVTGGTKGMGRAAAECFAADGARVAVLARGAAALDETAAALSARGSPDVMALAVDVTDRPAVEEAFARIGARWGELNVLVNTVGPGAGRLEELSDEQWRQTFAVGTMAAVHCVRAALPLLRRAGWARIVNVSAHSIQRQSPMLVAYTASKAALTSISKNLARSLAPEGILVNTVSPGTIVTASFTENLSPVLDELGLDASDPGDVMRWIADTFHQPADLGRAGLPDEVGAVIAFLGSRRNGYVTGANVNVDGGSDFV